MNIFPEVLCPCGTCVGRATAYNYGEPVCFKWTLQATDCTLASSICGDTTDTAYCQVCGARLSFEKNGKPVADVRASALRDALDAAEARATLAERQVRVLAELFCERYFLCPELCPAYQRDVCYRYETSGPHCVDQWLVWSSAQAQGGGGGE